MQTRVAVMAVIVEDDDAAEKLNAVLHHYGEHIIGRMGISLSPPQLMQQRLPKTSS